jgi:hypothetical protein
VEVLPPTPLQADRRSNRMIKSIATLLFMISSFTKTYQTS